MIIARETIQEGVGKAYAFFYCAAPKADVEKALPKAREQAKTPNGLELTLREGIDPINFGLFSRIRTLAEQARQEGNNYSIEAALPGASNRKTAEELVTIQNALYASPLKESFHKGGHKYLGGTVYRAGEDYEFME